MNTFFDRLKDRKNLFSYFGAKLTAETQKRIARQLIWYGEIRSAELLKEAIAQDCVLKLASNKIISDDIARYAVQCDGRSLLYLTQQFLDNPEINRIAIARTPEAVRWALPEFRAKPELMFPVGSEYGMLAVASAELQDNSDFVYLACKDDRFEQMRFASDRIKCDADFILTVLNPKELSNLTTFKLSEGLLRLAISKKNNMTSSAYLHKLTPAQVFPHVPAADLESASDRVNSLIRSASNYGYATFRDSEALAKAVNSLELNYPDFTQDQIERAIVFDWCVAYRL